MKYCKSQETFFKANEAHKNGCIVCVAIAPKHANIADKIGNTEKQHATMRTSREADTEHVKRHTTAIAIACQSPSAPTRIRADAVCSQSGKKERTKEQKNKETKERKKQKNERNKKTKKNKEKQRKKEKEKKRKREKEKQK